MLRNHRVLPGALLPVAFSGRNHSLDRMGKGGLFWAEWTLSQMCEQIGILPIRESFIEIVVVFEVLDNKLKRGDPCIPIQYLKG